MRPFAISLGFVFTHHRFQTGIEDGHTIHMVRGTAKPPAPLPGSAPVAPSVPVASAPAAASSPALGAVSLHYIRCAVLVNYTLFTAYQHQHLVLEYSYVFIIDNLNYR